MTKKGLNSIKFNLLNNKFINKYNCIICWRVFVRFTEEDINYALDKIHDALENEGILIFNLISRESKKDKRGMD